MCKKWPEFQISTFVLSERVTYLFFKHFAFKDYIKHLRGLHSIRGSPWNPVGHLQIGL